MIQPVSEGKNEWLEKFGVTWRVLLQEEVKRRGDCLVTSTLTDEEADSLFGGGYGSTAGPHFPARRERYVYFPACYDGKQWADSVPRNPCNEKTEHVGGG